MARQVVIAHHTEELRWLSNILPYFYNESDLSVILYHKSPNHNVELRPGPLLYPIIYRHQVPNEGRDLGTMLTHLARIASNVPPSQVVFLQGGPKPHLPSELLDMGSEKYFPLYVIQEHEELIRPMSHVVSCDLNGYPHHPGLRLAESWREIQAIADPYDIYLPGLPRRIEFCAGAMFSVRTDKLISPPEFWVALNEWLLLDPILGYILERLIGYILRGVAKE